MLPPLRIHNTLTRQLDVLEAVRENRVGIYCCGPTVYDIPHVGHARAALVPDLLVRRLRAKGAEVRYVRNITDVDDKILERAQHNGEPPLALSERMAVVYRSEMREIGCVDPDFEPKVSDHLPQIFELVSTLIQNGSAYAIDLPNGKRDVYFAVRSFPEYGKLSRRRIDELLVGARVERDDSKRDPLDFALWKGAATGEWGWESPWGLGRPGWHIECSAMCAHYLGHGFDVHCGGMDLIFPHHENEVAQSEAAHPGEGPLSRIWMHNGFVNIDKEKMSKSLGNFVTLRDVLDRNDPEALRWFLLAAHYRGPIQFDTDTRADGRVVFPGVDEAERRLDYVYGALDRVRELVLSDLTAPSRLPPELQALKDRVAHAEQAAEAALDDDLNTPVALAQLGEVAAVANELTDFAKKRLADRPTQAAAGVLGQNVLTALRRFGRSLGLLNAAPSDYFGRVGARRLALRGLTPAAIDARIDARARARRDRDFATSDAIRDELTALGVHLFDSPAGTSWTIAQ
jgi:cysteinyl-tRNA synthetase